MANLFAASTHEDTSSLFEAHYDDECARCFRSFFTGERVGFVADELCCESCYTQETRLRD